MQQLKYGRRRAARMIHGSQPDCRSNCTPHLDRGSSAARAKIHLDRGSSAARAKIHLDRGSDAPNE
jgi:hypothetical protein